MHHNTGLFEDPFNKVYNEYTGIYDTGYWDGVVKSGSWVAIQTWSTNPRYIGFDGEISIKPVTASVAEDIDVSHTITCTSIDPNYQVGLRKAVNGAKKKFYKKLNKVLVSKGIKNKPSRMRRYEKMLERVAQNIYEGLSYVREEQVAKGQGTVANPLDSPNYYDGTSTMYGGSQEEVLYDNSKTARIRENSGSGLGGTGTSSNTTTY